MKQKTTRKKTTTATKAAAPKVQAPRGPSRLELALERVPERWDFWMVFGLAWLVRLVYVVVAWAWTYSFDITLKGLDQFTYQTQAGYILDGDLLLRKAGLFYYSPVYSYFCAAVYKIFGNPNFWALHLIQTVTGALTCALGYALARTWLRRPAALLAGALYALAATWLYYEQELLHEGFMLLFYMVLLWALRTAQLGRRWGAARLLGAGAIGMMAMIGRGNAGLVLVALVPWILWMTPVMRPALHPRLNVTGALAFCAGVALLFGPLLVRNRIVAGRWALGMGNGKVLFYIGNNAQGNGEFQYTPRFQEAFDKANQGDADVYRRYFLEDLRDAPGHLIKVNAYKTYALFASHDLPDNLNFHLGRRTHPVARFTPVQWEWLVPLGLVGLGLGLARRRRDLNLLWLFTGVFAASLIIIIPIGRYRQPVLIPLVIFAALAAEWAVERWREGRTVRLLPAGLALFALVIALWPSWHPLAIRANDYQIGIRMALLRGRTELAERLLRAGQREHPNELMIALSAWEVAQARNDRAAMRRTGEVLLKNPPISPDIALVMAEIYLEDGRLDMARKLAESLAGATIEGGEAIQAQARALLERINQR